MLHTDNADFCRLKKPKILKSVKIRVIRVIRVPIMPNMSYLSTSYFSTNKIFSS